MPPSHSSPPLDWQKRRDEFRRVAEEGLIRVIRRHRLQQGLASWGLRTSSSPSPRPVWVKEASPGTQSGPARPQFAQRPPGCCALSRTRARRTRRARSTRRTPVQAPFPFSTLRARACRAFASSPLCMLPVDGSPQAPARVPEGRTAPLTE